MQCLRLKAVTFLIYLNLLKKLADCSYSYSLCFEFELDDIQIYRRVSTPYVWWHGVLVVVEESMHSRGCSPQLFLLVDRKYGQPQVIVMQMVCVLVPHE